MHSDRIKKSLAALTHTGVLDAKDAKRDENLHRIYMYPAMMVPATQSAIVEIIVDELNENSWVIDPFMGSGTTLLSCMEYHMNVMGQDINPMAVITTLAKTKNYNVPQFRLYLNEIKETLNNDQDKTVDVRFDSIDKWFPITVQEDLSKIRRAIMHIPEKDFRYFFWVAMAETIRVSSNDRTSTFKLHRRTQEEINRRNIDVISHFLNLCQRSLEDLSAYIIKLEKKNLIENYLYKGQIDVRFGNSLNQIDYPVQFDMLLSSPPYGDNHTTVTYGQHSYLALQWIDPNDIPSNVNYNYLHSTQEIDRVSLGGKVIGGRKEEANALLQTIPSLNAFIKSIPEKERKKYDKTISFIMDFDQSIRSIIPVMKRNAFYIWTIGNRNVGKRVVPNDMILIDIMKKYGIELFYQAERTIFNKNQPNKNNFSSTMEKEKILIFHNEL